MQIATLYMKTYCTACKREGFIAPQGPRHPGTAPNGKAWALGGDINVCGCNPPPVFHAPVRGMRMTFTGEELVRMGVTVAPAHAPQNEHAHEHYDLFFHAKHERTGKDLCHVRYKITLEDGRQFIGVTDENGYTQKVSADTAQVARIEIPHYDNSTTDTSSEPEPCGC
ncbi:hypothetical protein [Ralstonia sp. A12]|uniref:hypothetical protein n=1 Tax=Ralstonia sp. A12 TaxID=1217052 RepID=UPI001E417504|nr:hypothetical protein [Ralstonia sp. A12]